MNYINFEAINQNRLIQRTMSLTGLIITLSFSVTAVAQSSDPFYFSGAAENCYRQTLLVKQGAAPESLSTTPCNQALKNNPVSRKQEIAAYHNRGIIELAKGDPAAARNSFERAVQKSPAPGLSHLALAQLAHKHGDYTLAIELYDSLLSSDLVDARILRHQAAIERKRLAAQRSNEEQKLAMTQ